MRSADAIPPTGRPVSRPAAPTHARRWVTALLLIALVVAALPQPTPAVAQPDPAQTPLPTTITDASGIPTGALVPAIETPATGEATTAPSELVPDGASSEPATLAPSAEVPAVMPDPGTSAAPLASAAGSDPAEPVGTTTATATDEPLLITAADVTLPVVCQLVLRATALTPPPGTGIGDPLLDPVALAAFSVSVAGGGAVTLLTAASGVLNIFPEALANADLAVTTGDTVTVAQVTTRAGLTLGEPPFAMTFAWQTAFSPTCRVETFVVNPATATPPSITPSPSQIGPASPSAGPSLAPSTVPSPSPLISPSPSPSPTATTVPSPTQPAITATTAPTATSLPTIPAGFGQIEVIVVARPSPGASPGSPQTRLAGARLTIVNRTGRILTATITTGADGSALSPLLAVGTYDLILDNPPVGYLGAQAQGFDVASPTIQRFVFQLEVNTAPTPSPSASAGPTNPPPTATATARASGTPRATSTTRATTATPTVRAATATATPTVRAATATATATATPTVRAATATATIQAPTVTPTVQAPGTVAVVTPTRRPTRATSTPGGTTVPGAPTATIRPATATALATATIRPATATVSMTATPRPSTTPLAATATVRPPTSVATATVPPATATSVTGTPPRPTRAPATGAAATATATRTPTPRPAGTGAATVTTAPGAPTATTATGNGTPSRPPRATSTVPGTPTRVTQIQDASISVYVSICIDPRFIDFGEFGSETDLGPRYLTDIDRSRCRPARSGETRITLTSTYPNYLPAYAQTNSTDANGRMSFVFPAQREQRIGSLHLEGPIPAQDAGVKIDPGRVLVIPLTIVILDPAIGTTGMDLMAASAPPVSSNLGWLPGTLAILGLLLALAVVRRFGTRGR